MSSLKVYNSLTKKLEEFKPLNPPQVKMYVCGPTVYDLLHVGNFRGPVIYNMIRNWLEFLGYHVDFALNFTDVDDKIIQRAQTLHVDPSLHSEKCIQEYKRDFQSLGLRSHDHNPKVTETISEIVDFVQKLVDSKKAYAIDKGSGTKDVLFSIESFSDYGKLSGRKVDELMAGARVEVDESKKNPMDFALWKAAKSGEPSWGSPWGPGRPGWHIECSAMIHKIFGEQIDIHGGGSDLIFPHHENEIAQSEALTGKKMVQYWIHVAMLNFGGQKMSKSLGNVTSLRGFLEKNHAEIYKWMILSSHYRSVADFSETTLQQSVASLSRIYSALVKIQKLCQIQEGHVGGSFSEFEIKLLKKVKEFEEKKSSEKFYKDLNQSLQEIKNAMNEDFGTPAVFSVIFELIRKFNAEFPALQGLSAEKKEKALYLYEFIKSFGKICSLFQEPHLQFLKDLDDRLLKQKNLQRTEIDRLVEERTQARLNKDYKKSDELRDHLKTLGISVMDSAEGTMWEVTK